MKKKAARGWKEYVQSGDHLPDFLRDFHDQKDIFKTIEWLYGRENRAAGGIDMGVDWISAQVYVIDRFLWFMGQRGYTLQRSRSNVEFRSFEDDLKLRRQQEVDLLKTAMAPKDQEAPR